MYDFTSYIRISPEQSSPHAPAAWETRSFKGFRRCERTLHGPERFQLSQQWLRTHKNASLSSFLARRSFALGSTAQTFASSSLNYDFFLKTVPDIRHPEMRKKIACIVIRFSISHDYCHYYSRHAIVVTTVLTTVATENHMMMHAIFFLIYGCPMLCTDFFKNSDIFCPWSSSFDYIMSYLTIPYLTSYLTLP